MREMLYAWHSYGQIRAEFPQESHLQCSQTRSLSLRICGHTVSTSMSEAQVIIYT